MLDYVVLGVKLKEIMKKIMQLILQWPINEGLIA